MVDENTEYGAVLFDNDGVLTHPTPGTLLTSAVEAAFAAVGIDEPADKHVRAVVDDPETITEVCQRYGLDPEQF